MPTRRRPFARAPMSQPMTAALAVALRKEALDWPFDPSPDFLFSPGELHDVVPSLPGHLGVPMLRRAARRSKARGEPRMARAHDETPPSPPPAAPHQC